MAEAIRRPRNYTGSSMVERPNLFAMGQTGNRTEDFRQWLQYQQDHDPDWNQRNWNSYKDRYENKGGQIRKKPTPIYKQGWFWPTLGIGAGAGLLAVGALGGASAAGAGSSILPSSVPISGSVGMTAAPAAISGGAASAGTGILASSVPVAGGVGMTAAPASISSQAGLGPSYSMLSNASKLYRAGRTGLNALKESPGQQAAREDNRLSNLSNLMGLAGPDERQNDSYISGGLLTKTFRKSPEESGLFSGY